MKSVNEIIENIKKTIVNYETLIPMLGSTIGPDELDIYTDKIETFQRLLDFITGDSGSEKELGETSEDEIRVKITVRVKREVIEDRIADYEETLLNKSSSRRNAIMDEVILIWQESEKSTDIDWFEIKED